MLGGGISAIGFKQLKPYFDKSKARASYSGSTVPASSGSVVQVIQADTDIERAAMDPEFIVKFKDSRDKLSSGDKSAMKKLIEKVTE